MYGLIFLIIADWKKKYSVRLTLFPKMPPHSKQENLPAGPLA